MISLLSSLVLSFLSFFALCPLQEFSLQEVSLQEEQGIIYILLLLHPSHSFYFSSFLALGIDGVEWVKWDWIRY